MGRQMAQRIKEHATYLWQEVPRIPVYRIQTTDHRIARKIKKRKSKLCVYGVNAPFWVFQLKYSSPKKAILGLGNITGASVEETADTGVFVAYTLPYTDTGKDVRVEL